MKGHRMGERIESEFEVSSGDQHAALLQDLERQRLEAIQRLRAHERLDIKMRVWMRPGNSSERSEGELEGLTGDISRGGCRAIFALPARVGDVYRLRFDATKLDIPPVFARCLRCRLLREDAFEAGFEFFTPIALADRAATDANDLLA